MRKPLIAERLMMAFDCMVWWCRLVPGCATRVSPGAGCGASRGVGCNAVCQRPIFLLIGLSLPLLFCLPETRFLNTHWPVFATGFLFATDPFSKHPLASLCHYSFVCQRPISLTPIGPSVPTGSHNSNTTLECPWSKTTDLAPTPPIWGHSTPLSRAYSMCLINAKETYQDSSLRVDAELTSQSYV